MISVHQEVTGAHSGQIDCNLVASMSGEWVGWLSYSEFDGDVSVRFIAVPEEHRRRGIGTALVVALQERYPDRPIDFGMVTEDGEALLKSLQWRIVENDEVMFAEKRMVELRKTLEDYEASATSLNEVPADARAEILERLSDWNDLSDELDRFERIVESSQREFRFVVIDHKKELAVALGM